MNQVYLVASSLPYWYITSRVISRPKKELQEQRPDGKVTSIHQLLSMNSSCSGVKI